MTSKALQDEYPRPIVYHGCERCGVKMQDVYEGLIIVSPQHVAHFGDGDRTQCGKDATGEKWWWPL